MSKRILAMAGLAVLCAAPVAASAELRAGESFPALVFEPLDGGKGSLADYRGRKIALHVFADSTESLVFFFLEKDKPFDQQQRQIRWFDGAHRSLPVMVSELDGADIEMTVFEPLHLRQSPPSPIDGRPQRRASLAELECLLQERIA